MHTWVDFADTQGISCIPGEYHAYPGDFVHILWILCISEGGVHSLSQICLKLLNDLISSLCVEAVYHHCLY